MSLIAKFLGRIEAAELASILLVESVRDSSADQPKGVNYLSTLFEPNIEAAIQIMEENISEPLSTYEISLQVGISLRQLERQFNKALQKSPGRYYRQVRVKNARAMVTRSNLDMIEIALATGFGSTSTFSRAYRQEYLVSPTMDRSNRRHGLSSY
jgi:transcriptional regulator GlxA family with amidase domain